MKFKSHCKINLFLHVLGKQDDGYHRLESLFYFPEIYDEIEVSEGSETRDKGPAQLKITGKFADKLSDNKDDNLIIKSYELLKERFPKKIPELNFTLTKNLPVSAGIGGGSANAAAVLRELNNKYNLGLSNNELYKIGVKIGADVPPCILSKPCFAEGVGEIITEITEFPKLYVLLVNPLVAVSTAEIFKMGGFSTPHPGPLPQRARGFGFKTTQNLIDFLETTNNDLQNNAKKLCPDIENMIKQISDQSGCLLARMSGSGATCFGIFETKDKALAAQENIHNNNPTWWVQTG